MGEVYLDPRHVATIALLHFWKVERCWSEVSMTWLNRLFKDFYVLASYQLMPQVISSTIKTCYFNGPQWTRWNPHAIAKETGLQNSDHLIENCIWVSISPVQSFRELLWYNGTCEQWTVTTCRFVQQKHTSQYKQDEEWLGRLVCSRMSYCIIPTDLVWQLLFHKYGSYLYWIYHIGPFNGEAEPLGGLFYLVLGFTVQHVFGRDSLNGQDDITRTQLGYECLTARSNLVGRRSCWVRAIGMKPFL